MLEELLKELEELRKYKERYEIALQEKERMSKMLYEFMIKEYESTTKEERICKYKKEYCKSCRYNYDCNVELPEEILKPIPSEIAWIPGKIQCKNFRWS